MASSAPASAATNGRPAPVDIKPGQLFINGRWRDAEGGKTMPTSNPATEEVITTLATASAGDVSEAIDAANAAFLTWSKLRGSERAKIMQRIADLIETHKHELAYREAVDMGKLYTDVTFVDVPHIANMFRYYAGWCTKVEGAVKPVEPIPGMEGHPFAFTRREPLGVIGAITPFNFPLILTVSKVAPALAAGNCIIHKPSSNTSLTSLTLAQIMAEAGVPDGVYQTVTGPGSSVGDALIKSPRIEKIAFTGSTGVGRQLAKDAADTMKHVTLELGGKSPNVVMADADLEKAVETATFAIFWNKGEVCVAGSRLLVEQSIFEEFLERFIARVKTIKTGDPLDPSTQMGPLADDKEYAKVLRYVGIGKDEDKLPLACGGNSAQINGKGFFIEPTVFAPASNKTRVAQEEIFGPVLPVLPFKDLDEAIEIANDTPYGLASGIQTRDYKKAMKFAEHVKAGTVWINTWHQYDPSAPFGGYKLSGYGREHGIESFEAYTQHKTVWLDLE
jgi:aldehyde dehydrogenase (NAD+)